MSPYFHSYYPCMCSGSWLLPGLLQCILTGSPGSICLSTVWCVLNIDLTKSLPHQKYFFQRERFKSKLMSWPQWTSTFLTYLLFCHHVSQKLGFRGTTSCYCMSQVLCSFCLPCLEGPSSLSSQTNPSLSSKTQLCCLQEASLDPTLGHSFFSGSPSQPLLTSILTPDGSEVRCIIRF